MTPIDIDEVRAWAVASGDLARLYFNHVASRRKADRSIVTEADEAIERLLVERISARYPNHGILGEEHTQQNLRNEFVWVLDPIDGTASFVSGLGSWCVSIGLLRDGVPFLGVISMPMLGDCYHAEVQRGAFLNDAPIQASAPVDWDGEDWLATPASLHRRFDLDFLGKTRVLGSTAAQMCYVARGSALGALLVDARPWDIAAGLVVVHEAAGTIAPLDPQVDLSAPLLEGHWSSTPLLVAHPSQIAALRRIVCVRADHGQGAKT